MPKDWEWHPTPLDEEIMSLLDKVGAKEVKIFTRRVYDGSLRSIVSCDPPDYKWNLTITFMPKGRRKDRFPSWEEVTDARYELLPANLTMALYLPPIEDVVPTTTSLRLVEVKGSDDD